MNEGGYGNMVFAGTLGQQATVWRLGDPLANDQVNAKRPELAEYTERLGAALGYTEELVQTLEKRLSSVSAPSAPTTGSQCTATPAAVTYYGQQLHAGIERLSVVNGTILSMLERLEA